MARRVLYQGGVGALPPPQLVFFAILLVSFVLLVTEKLRNDVVAVLIVIALASTRLLSPAEALSGFGSEPAIVVAAIFVLSAGLHRTGVAESLGRLIGRWAGDSWTRAIAVIAVTASVMTRDRQKTMAAGFDGYQAKPIEVVAAVRHAVGHAAQADPP